jgi:UDP-arabinose 4-epimerase
MGPLSRRGYRRPGAGSEFHIHAIIHLLLARTSARYLDTNVTKTLALLDAALDAGLDKIVFSSSCATYGVPRTLPISEDHPQISISPYGASKLFVESILHWYERGYGTRYTSLRYFNAAGADPRWRDR